MRCALWTASKSCSDESAPLECPGTHETSQVEHLCGDRTCGIYRLAVFHVWAMPKHAPTQSPHFRDTGRITPPERRRPMQAAGSSTAAVSRRCTVWIVDRSGGLLSCRQFSRKQSIQRAPIDSQFLGDSSRDLLPGQMRTQDLVIFTNNETQAPGQRI
jgi:hypothetical protein